MEDQIISFETAELAKEKYLETGVYPPSQSLLQKWLREKHGIRIVVDEDFDIYLGFLRGWIPKVNGVQYFNQNDCFEKYEEALEIALKKALLLIQ
jgi:hypothetical protein